MTLEERKNNVYFDQSGKQILPGDLLKVFHFRSRNKNYYMYQVVVIEGIEGFDFIAAKSYYADTPHYKLYSMCNNPQRIYFDAKIISERDSQAKRLKIKLIR